MAEGIKKSDLVVGDPITEIKADLDAMASSLDKVDEQLKSVAKTMKSDINPTFEKTSKNIREINEQEIKSEKLLREKLINEEKVNKVKIAQERLAQAELRTKVANNKEAERQEKIKQRNLKLTRDEIILNDKNAGTLEKTEAKSRLLRKERRKLNLETEKGRKRLKLINAELDRNNAIIENNSDKLTKQRIGIGRYQKALGKLRGALGAIGVTFGLSQLFRGVGGTIIEFDDAVANLGATSGKSAKELEPLIAQSKELGATTQFTATEISNLQLELAKLGFSTDEILASTGAVSNFAAATGAELPAAAKLAGSAVRAFGLEAEDMERVVSTLAVATTKTALDFQFLESGLSTVAPVAKTFGLSIEDTTAMLGQLANSGFDASSAATATRNILLNLADSSGDLSKELAKPVEDIDRFAESLGVTVEEAKEVEKGFKKPVKSASDLALRLRVLKERGVDLNDTLQLTDKRSVAAFNTFLDGSGTLEELTGKITGQNKALKDMAEKRLESVSGQWKLFTSALQGYILGASDSTDATEKLKDLIKSLTKNLTFILDTGGKVLRFFLVYKTVMKANQILTGKFGLSLKGVVKGFKSLIKGGKGAIKTLKGIGKALKGIGFGIALELFIEAAAALWDIASGAKAAREALQSLERANENAAKNVERIVNKQSELFNKRMKELDLEIRTRVANGEKEEDLAKEKIERERKITEETIKSLKATKKFKEDVLTDTLKDESRLKELIGKSSFTELERDELAELATKYTGFSGEREKALKLASEKANRLIKESELLSQSITEFNDVLAEQNVQQKEQASETGSGRGGRSPRQKELEKQASLLKEIEDSENDLIKNKLERDKQRLDIEVARSIEEIEKSTAVEEEKSRLKELVIKQYLRDINKLEADAQKERLEQAKEIIEGVELPTPKIPEAEDFGLGFEEEYNRKRLELLRDTTKTEEQIELESTQFRISLLEREISIRKELGLETLNLELELAALRRNAATDDNKEIFDAYRNLQEALTSVLSDQIDERIRLEKKRGDAAEAEQKRLEDLAARGNVKAQQSIAEQIEIQRAAEQEADRLAKVKQNIEMISAGLKTFTQALDDGETPSQALATTLTTTQVLASILGNLNFFAKGTDNAPEGWAVVDEQGAEIITDKKGNIKDLGTGGGARWKYLEAGDKVKTARESNSILNKFDQIGMSKTIEGAKDHAGNSYDLMILNETMNAMRGDMSKLQTQINVDWQGFASGVARLNVHTNKGGDRRTERYTVR